ncbi:peroxidase N1-like [Carica papaya]|uniref:peroxidase N1-like n=1 Tax=Carica papaya TaxID=3649 RepID=UPI000B8C74BC|nr:peroxidase N1-like [Carica papaya]
MKPNTIRLSIFMLVIFGMHAILVLGRGTGRGTRVGFYSTTCPQVESIVKSAVQARFDTDPTVAPGLLRMHFHDCFVRGCDGSILLEGSNTERTAIPNSNLRGFDVIQNAKTQLEAKCPGVVSCADILALATRDSIVLSGGPSWAVPTGRRDGRVSLQSEVGANIPGPTESVAEQKRKFSVKGLNIQDLVVLVGGHTIGTAGCAVITGRLFNFNGTAGASDPSINPSFLPTLQALCPQGGNPATRVPLDTGSVDKFDTSFFANLRNGKGVLQSDQVLWTDRSTRSFVQRFLTFRAFNPEFTKSMIKMSKIGVLTGLQGEIRKVCNTVN